MTYVIECNNDGHVSYLNHSCMNTLSFGCEEMAWETDDKEKAELMLYKVEKEVNGAYKEFSVVEF